ncbi:MAG: hypothetical protein FJX68_16350 [Alphaproteobacteria bacterium]|nr:hypothetical protein [Alphaproteobacteria bacterium]
MPETALALNDQTTTPQPDLAPAQASAADVSGQLAAEPQIAVEPQIAELLGLRLVMNCQDEADVDRFYEQHLRPKIKSRKRLEAPYQRIDSKLKDGTQLNVHLAPAGKGRAIFAVEVVERIDGVCHFVPSLDALMCEVQRRFGLADRISTYFAKPGQVIMIYGDPERGEENLAAIGRPPAFNDELFAGFGLGLDPNHRRAALGRGFRGVVVTMRRCLNRTTRAAYVKMHTELLDLERAEHVFV